MDFDCFEKGSGVGGNWRYDNDNGMSSAYRSLFINTSRRMMEYATYPMPEDYPDYPHHTQIAAYFDDYVDHFWFRERIRFRTEVTSVEPAPGGSYRVTLDDGQTHHYEAVLVANGHHWDPRLPEPPSRARTRSPATSFTHTGTASQTSASSRSGCWCSASATPPPTSRSRPRATPRSPTWPSAAAPT